MTRAGVTSDDATKHNTRRAWEEKTQSEGVSPNATGTGERTHKQLTVDETRLMIKGESNSERELKQHGCNAGENLKYPN